MCFVNWRFRSFVQYIIWVPFLFLLFENSIFPTNTVCRGIVYPCKLCLRGLLFYTAADFVWVYCFHVVCASACQYVTFCFLNILKSHCWNFIKLCKHIHIYNTNFNKKKVIVLLELFSFVIRNGFYIGL